MRKELSLEKIEEVLRNLMLIFEFTELNAVDLIHGAKMNWNDSIWFSHPFPEAVRLDWLEEILSDGQSPEGRSIPATVPILARRLESESFAVDFHIVLLFHDGKAGKNTFPLFLQ